VGHPPGRIEQDAPISDKIEDLQHAFRCYVVKWVNDLRRALLDIYTSRISLNARVGAIKHRDAAT